MYNIAIRADGGEAVGMGHIMRCLAVAEELKNLGCRVYFLGLYMQGINKVKEMGFDAFQIILTNSKSQINTIPINNVGTYNSVNTGFNYGSKDDLDNDIFATKVILEQQGCDLLIVDKYNLSSDYFKKLKECIKKVAFIDDLNLFDCVADIIVNGNINAKSLGYKQIFNKQSLLLGTNYTPLRTEFRNIPKRETRALLGLQHISKNTDCLETNIQIMLTTGGSDPYNCTGQLLKILLECEKTSNIRYNVIVTSGFVYSDKIKKIADNNSNVVLYENYKYLSEVMQNSDLAISSGGSTLYELCCCGTPTLAFILADNQTGIVDRLSSEGYIQSFGWYTDIGNSNIAQRVHDLIMNFGIRKDYSYKMQTLIDGKGAYRIAKEIVKVIG